MWIFVDAETMEPISARVFPSIDDADLYVDKVAEAWDPFDEVEEGFVYEVTLDGEELEYWLLMRHENYYKGKEDEG